MYKLFLLIVLHKVHMEQKRSHSESVVFLFIKQVKAANDWESYFGLGYRKLSMESKGDIPGIGTLALIYWNHFFKAGPFLFHMIKLLLELK